MEMLAKESGGSNFDLPEEVLQVLPSDPFEQLDVARKIASVALSTRVSALESESYALRAKLAEKDQLIAELQAEVESVDASLSETADKLALADQEKEGLVKEKALLSNTVRKLNRDVSKLEVFRKTLMRSLEEEDENSTGASEAVAKPKIQTQENLSSKPQAQVGEGDATLPPSRASSIRSQYLKQEAYFRRIVTHKHTSVHSSWFSSSLFRIRIPNKNIKTCVPKRYSMSFATSRGMFDDRSSMPSSHHSSEYGRTRVDGKEFFRQVRSRLSYEQFGAFLANVKELNGHKQTKEETLQKADEIFGPDNKDLYAIFEGLISRTVH
ncbi:hypothetical protein Prudu_001204 [Prunus dulcis]|uniref:At4g15545-like C-terminal domain-containing protein n=1 Tax=Prunus dulcis TaxID=3755 RepID=A0A4Y1QN31_PRUDU|nr:hypothetical protein Prudu_001204 [Prunus dulcis]